MAAGDTYTCRCGHTWTQKVGTEPPKVCPKCKVRNWDKPFARDPVTKKWIKYGGKDVKKPDEVITFLKSGERKLGKDMKKPKEEDE